MQTATDDDIIAANKNVASALNDSLTQAINGHPDTEATCTATVCVQIYDDGNITTRIAGLVNKNQLFGAMVEAILSIHEFDKANEGAKIEATLIAYAEKRLTDDRTDN